MELKDYISTTLTEIVNGVVDAQKNVTDSGAKINPMLVGGMTHVAASGGGLETVEGSYAQMVEFDVVITTIEGEGSKKGIGVLTGLLSAGASGETSTENVIMNKLRFKIPLSLPVGS